MILCLGHNGQLGKALSKYKDIKTVGREDCDFKNTKCCINFIKTQNPKAIIIAATIKVDIAEDEVN